MKTVIEMAQAVGYPLMTFDGKPYVSPELARLVELARADERNATLDEIAKWLEDEKNAPYWAELVRARRSNT